MSRPSGPLELPGTPTAHGSGDAAVAQLRRARSELEERLRSGQPCRAEDLLAEYPTVAAWEELALDLIRTEFALRQQLGQEPRAEDWYARFPQYRGRLEQELRGQASLSQSAPIQAATEAEAAPPDLLGQPPHPGSGWAPPRYELVEELGKGGMGEVYRARDRVLGRVVALKRIRRGRSGPEEVRRFRREAQAVARLQHRHIVPLHDLGEHDGEPFLVMGLVGGGNLASRLADFGDLRVAAALMEKVARAVQAAHEAGVVHRDLKPANILFDDAGEPHVSDFGLAKFLDPEEGEDATQTGQVLGTPAYMAPEQAAGHGNRAMAASDVWALGVILYELLTGRRPFAGSGSAVAVQVRTAEPPPPRDVRPGLDRALETVVLKCLRKEPGQRYATAGGLADDLGRWLGGEAVLARPESLVRRVGRRLRRRAAWVVSAALLFLLGLTAVGGALVLSRAPSSPDLSRQSDRSPQAEALAALGRDLEAGRPVTLVPATGLPRYYRWRTEKQRPPLTPQGPEPFSLESYSTTLLDLLPDPGTEGYRFSAEVNPEVTRAGSAGIYCLAEERASDQGAEQYFIALTFAHQGPMSGRVWLQAVRYREADAERGYDRQDLLLGTAPLAEPGWHRLSLEVRGDEITAACDGKALPKVNLAKDRWMIKQWWDAQHLGTAPLPTFAPRSPLGLFLRRGTASFKNVQVTPLESVQPQ